MKTMLKVWYYKYSEQTESGVMTHNSRIVHSLPLLPSRHSSMSVQVSPSPLKPSAQEHSKDPGRFLQTALLSQGRPSSHSSMSWHVGPLGSSSSSLNPLWQLHEKEPRVLVQSPWAPQELFRHSSENDEMTNWHEPDIQNSVKNWFRGCVNPHTGQIQSGGEITQPRNQSLSDPCKGLMYE